MDAPATKCILESEAPQCNCEMRSDSQIECCSWSLLVQLETCTAWAKPASGLFLFVTGIRLGSSLKDVALIAKLLQKLAGLCQGLLLLQHPQSLGVLYQCQHVSASCTLGSDLCLLITAADARHTRLDRLSSSSQASWTARPSSVLELKESW